MAIKKAVITAAGRGTRHYPATSAVRKELFPLVDRDGITKSVMQLIVEEVLESGIDDICIVASPGGDEDFKKYFSGLQPDEITAYASKEWAIEQSEKLEEMGSKLSYAIQEVQDGYGHAVYCARDFVGDEPFLLLLGDHIYVSNADERCSLQVLQVFNKYGISSAGVKQTPEKLLHRFGTVAGEPVDASSDTYRISAIKEKPSADYAKAYLATPGIPSGQFLCFYGIQCFTPAIFDCLEYHIRNDIRERGEIQLTSSMEMVRAREGFMAVEIHGERYDVGVPLGYLETQAALALKSPFRDAFNNA
jgi:UTP--glucose-1-phosphate uridylyltransferase